MQKYTEYIKDPSVLVIIFCRENKILLTITLDSLVTYTKA